MKTLATCRPTEFLRQANIIKKYAEKWLDDTNILNIRQNLPKLETVPSDASPEDRIRIAEENRKKANEQTRKNLSDILDSILENHPEETLQLLALCCFIEPENIDEHEVSEYLDAIAELIGNQSVLSFFTSVARLGRITSPDV